MRMRTLSAIATVALVTGVVTGCGGGSASDGPQKITYWASNQGTSIENDQQILRPILDQFTKETGIEVDLEVVGWADLQTKIQSAVTSGQGPDVVNIGNTWGTWLQSTGAFLPFDDDAAAAIGGLDRFVPTALDAGGAPGEVPTSVPLYGLAYGLYYNKHVFAEAGLEPPTTWEEMVQAAQKLTSGDRHGLSIAGASYTENVHFAFLTAAQNGADFYDDEGNPTFTDDGVIAGIKRYIDLMQKDKVVDPANAEVDATSPAMTELATGKAAMVLAQSNSDSTLEANGATADDFGVVTLPSPAKAAAQIATFPAGINISVFSYTSHRDAALQFVKWMTSEKAQAQLSVPYNTLPVLTGVEVPADKQVFLEAYNDKSKPLPQVATEGDFEVTVGRAISQMFADIAVGDQITEDDIRQAMKDAQAQIEAQG